VRRRRQDLRALVVEAASDYVAAAEQAGLTLTVNLAEDLPPVDTDPALVSKIIGTLLSNAIKYTPSDGRILLRAFSRPARDGQETGPWVAVEVSDTGPGIPAALRERVFDEFFRAPAATTTARGEGIGLAMSRRVARLLGGEVTVDGEEGRGATFTFWLPAQSSAAAVAAPSPPFHDRPASRAGEPIRDDAVVLDPEAPPAGAAPLPRAREGEDRRRRAIGD
jgi:signal transduction histidine kinase